MYLNILQLCIASDRPFRALGKFGSAFLNRLEASICSSQFLESVTLIDTPGVLAGEKQRVGRQYNFTQVIEWFAERCDRILLLFDAHKLDISDEFKRSIEALRGHDEKVRVVLNKADSVSPKQLMRVYGALMWSLGKVVDTPEVLRVYVGSFWHQELRKDHDNFRLFESEAADLLSDLRSLPRNSAIRKINELVKRARLAKVHAYIISHLRGLMPSLWGGSKKQTHILNNLPEEFTKVAGKYKIPYGDFPNVQRFREILSTLDLGKMPKLNEKAISRLDKALYSKLPEIMENLRETNIEYFEDIDSSVPKNPFKENNLQNGTEISDNLSSQQLGPDMRRWAISMAAKTDSDNIFYSSKLSANGKLQGEAAQAVFSQWGLPNDVLFSVWNLADIDKNDQLDSDEFAVAVHLMNELRNGISLPDVLPPELIPPSKR